MVKKIRKNTGRKQQLQQPDEVMKSLQGTYSFIEKYKFLIIGAIALSIVTIVAISAYTSYAENTKVAEADAFYHVFEVVQAPVVAPADLEEGTQPPANSFPTEAAKFEKVAAELNTFISEHGSSDIKDAAILLLASAYTRIDKNDEAVSQFNTFLADAKDGCLQSLAQENLGMISLKKGDSAAAAKYFEAMQAASNVPYLQARALVHLGDIANPSVTVAGADSKDAAKSVEYYKKALELMPADAEKGKASASLLPDLQTLTRRDIQMRLLLTPKS